MVKLPGFLLKNGPVRISNGDHATSTSENKNSLRSEFGRSEFGHLQSTSEIRTFGFRTTLKSERSIVRYGLVWISNVRILALLAFLML